MREVPEASAELRDPLLEREHEIAELSAIIDAAEAGTGQILMIEGLSGVGKTRLLEAAGLIAREQGLTVLKAHAGELERDHTWGLVLGLFESYLLSSTEEGRVTLLGGAGALAAPLLDLGGSVDQLATSDEFALLHGLYWATINLTDASPAVLLVDDAHWADEQSLRFLLYLAERIRELPLALIVSVRTGEELADQELLSRLTVLGAGQPLRPAELTLGATEELLDSVCITRVNREFALACWEVTRGNPFLLRELARSARTDLDAGRTLDPQHLTDFAPRSIGRSVVLRLSGLGENAVSLARACAILGDGAPYARASGLVELDLEAAAMAAARLLDAHLLASVDPVGFSHPMIRSAINAECPPGTRSQLQTRAARLMHRDGVRPDEIAPMLAHGIPIQEPWAQGVLHEAARSAASKGAPATAVQYLRRAISVCPQGDRPPAILIDLGLAEASAGEVTSLSRFEEALERIDQPDEERRALYALGLTLHRYGRHSEAAEVFARGQTRFEERDPEVAATFRAASIATSWFSAGDPALTIGPDTVAQLERAVDQILERSTPSGAERVLLAVVAGLRILHQGRVADATDLARRALDGAIGASGDGFVEIGIGLALIALISSGEPIEAEHAAEPILDDAQRRGDVLAFSEVKAIQALAAYSRGRLDAAMAHAEGAIAGIRHGWGTIVPIPQAILAQCHIEKGNLDAASTVLGSIEAASSTKPQRSLEAFFYWARGRLHAERGEHQAALDDYMSAGALFTQDGMNPTPAACSWRCPAAVSAAAIGDRELAARLVQTHLESSREFGLTAHVGVGLHTRALLGGRDSGTTDLLDAISLLEQTDAPLELARALATQGAWLRRSGHRTEAREPLRRARELASRCGAKTLAETAYHELLASGARPRRVASSGAGALTPTERRIVALVVQGYTNRQIAETLFVAINTVEWHLRHVFAKLDVANRSEIKDQLDSLEQSAKPPRIATAAAVPLHDA
jgi:DNA-binding CsgD family transcriptional regulator